MVVYQLYYIIINNNFAVKIKIKFVFIFNILMRFIHINYTDNRTGWKINKGSADTEGLRKHSRRPQISKVKLMISRLTEHSIISLYDIIYDLFT